MSRDFTFEIASDQEPATLFSALVTQCGFTKISEEVVVDSNVQAGVYSMSGTTPSDEVVRAFFKETHGFTPNVTVWFRPGKSVEFTSNTKLTAILRAAIKLLDHFPGNAVLLCDSDQTVLRRIDGHLQIDIRWYEGISLEGLSPDNFAYLAEKYS
jgi:hypothetical protein